MSAISTIPNLGPASEAAFRAAGLSSAGQIREMGVDAAYARLLQTGSRPHFIGYCALVMGLQGRPWTDCKGAEKARMRADFDRLVAARFDRGQAELDRFMDEIGLTAGPMP